MEGEDGESDDPRAFGSCHILKRILIVLAGSLMNLLMGLFVLLLVFMPLKRWPVPTIATIESQNELPENMLHPGDEIISVNGYSVYLVQDVNIGLTRDDGDGLHDITVIRDGKEKVLSNISFLETINNESESVSEENSDEQTESKVEEQRGYGISFKTEESTFFGKLKYTAQNGYNLVRLVFVGVGDLLSGSVSKDEISGPIGIGKVMAETAEADMTSLWYLFAFISINLGIMNLLPLPALDGGRFIFLLIELIFRKKVPPKYEAIVHAVGLILLLGLMAFVTFNDVINIF